MSIRNLVPWIGDRNVPVRHAEGALPVFHRTLDDLFDDFFRGFELAPFARLGDMWGTASPGLDVEENDTEYTVSAELPGWDEKEIDVSLSGDVLTIKAEKEKKTEEGEKGSDGYRRMRQYGSFHRSVRLPAEVDRDKVSAACQRGVLKVTLPKTEKARQERRRIEVKAS